MLLANKSEKVLRSAITEISQESVCDNWAAGKEPCRQCHQCQAAEEWVHPEIVIINSSDNKIKIKEIREASNKIARTTYANRRIVVIHQADRLTPAAANALLKILEEGNKKIRFVLSAKSPAVLIETIRSRCLLVSLSSVKRGVRVAEKQKDGEDVMFIFENLRKKLVGDGPSEEIKRGYLRLRDYFLISHMGGNVKLAKEVLLASVPDHFKTGK